MKWIINLVFAIIGFSNIITAQTPIGQWSAFYSYNEVTDFAEYNGIFYVGSKSGFYTFNSSTGDINAFNKISGMATPGVVCVDYDILTNIAVIGYSNSQIDLFQDGLFYNIPYLNLSQSSGNKDINNIICYKGEAFIATGKGLVVINLQKKEIKETVVFFDNNTEQILNDVAINNDTIFVCTNNGIFKTHLKNPSFIYYANWEKISNNYYQRLLINNNQLYALSDNVIDKITNSTASAFYTHTGAITSLFNYNANTIGFVSPVNGSSYKSVYYLNLSGNLIDSIENREIIKTIQLDNNNSYALENKRGIVDLNTNITYAPNAMPDFRSADVAPYNGNFGIAHGGHQDNYTILRNASLYTIFKDGNFHKLDWVSDDYTFSDFIRIIYNPTNGSYYSSAYGGVVSELTKDFTPIEHYGNLEPRKGESPAKTYSYGLALDKQNNLWVVNSGTDRLLKVKTHDGSWYASKPILNPITANLPLAQQSMAGDIVIDGNDNMWIVPINVSGGIIAYNANGTPENENDDYYRIFQMGKNLGGLPSNTVLSVAADKNNNVWIGTDNGIAVYSCSYDLRDNCDANLPIIENEKDKILGRLFEGIAINAIAVDGANRKWIGTPAGLWLVSHDGEQTISQFTTTNSPLPSNNIKRINIDPINGDVYISTDMGLVRYRGTATEGRAAIEKPLYIYPNPVPATFNGQIAINGLPYESDVKIVDMSGQLVYKTKSLGGQAVWDGKDYLGKKAQSGVYIVLVRTKDGLEKASGKIIFRE